MTNISGDSSRTRRRNSKMRPLAAGHARRHAAARRSPGTAAHLRGSSVHQHQVPRIRANGVTVEVTYVHLTHVASDVLCVRGRSATVELERARYAQPRVDETEREASGAGEEVDHRRSRHEPSTRGRFFRPAIPLENELLVGAVTSDKLSRGSTATSSHDCPMWSLRARGRRRNWQTTGGPHCQSARTLSQTIPRI